MSPETVAEVLEEVWTWDPKAIPNGFDTPASDGVIGEFSGPEIVCHAELDEERARVAACAPEALKLLVEIENSVKGIEGCVFCEGWKQHKSKCELVALLTKAGLR